MKLVIRKKAADTISNTAAWVNAMNTDGAGDRWFDRVIKTLQHAANTGVQHAICQNEELAKREYRCFTYNDKWVIAYKIKDNDFIVYRFILGSKLA
jgi:hypothetical protein